MIFIGKTNQCANLKWDKERSKSLMNNTFLELFYHYPHHNFITFINLFLSRVKGLLFSLSKLTMVSWFYFLNKLCIYDTFSWLNIFIFTLAAMINFSIFGLQPSFVAFIEINLQNNCETILKICQYSRLIIFYHRFGRGGGQKTQTVTS